MSKVEMPSAYITVNRGRKKIKQDKYVYLNNGQEFELELYNPTTDNVLVKIWINNKQMSSTGVVLRPGERVFLERYIDIPKKFLFDTYEVNGGSDSVQKAIEKNGLIKVQFFREQEEKPWVSFTPTILGGPYHDSGIRYNNQSPHSNGDWIGDFNTYGATSSSISNNTNFTSTFDTTSLGGTLGVTDVPQKKSLKSRSKKTETGRVEQGSSSSQTFETVNKKFSSWAFETVEYQIKPTSTQVIDTKMATSKYCTGCGKKAKPKNKFCSNCGTKL
jgi:hypothetical protein